MTMTMITIKDTTVAAQSTASAIDDRERVSATKDTRANPARIARPPTSKWEGSAVPNGSVPMTVLVPDNATTKRGRAIAAITVRATTAPHPNVPRFIDFARIATTMDASSAKKGSAFTEMPSADRSASRVGGSIQGVGIAMPMSVPRASICCCCPSTARGDGRRILRCPSTSSL
mmetsp:Transcript_34672/g.73076  ORF Transcript_34672/g.73076 Transcript_34672/m.73076 type:complete len:174 (+) Transcript_34672:310-831(+)